MARTPVNFRARSPFEPRDGRGVIAKARAPTLKDGRPGDLFVDLLAKRLHGPKDDTGWPDSGLLKGDRGWVPVLAARSDGARRVHQVVDWAGGEGEKPETGQYVGETGFVVAIADAVNMRGLDGPPMLVSGLAGAAAVSSYRTLVPSAEVGGDNEGRSLQGLLSAGGHLPFRTVAAAAAEDLLAAIKTVAIFDATSEQGGPGHVRERTEGEPDLPASRKHRSQDRFTRSGVIDSVNGGWWGAVAETTPADAATARAGTDDKRRMTSLTTNQQIRVIVEWINPRDPQFAGGVKANNIDDDAPALRAWIAYMKGLPGNSRYGGNGPVGVLPKGICKLASAHPTKTDRYLDMTGCHNMSIIAMGDGVSSLKGTGNLAVMRADDTTADPLYRHILRDFTIEAAGYANGNADGIDWGANNNCQTFNVRVWAAHRALAYANSFHSEHWNIRCNALGDLANNIGVYAKDGEAGITENAVGFYGGRIWGCKQWAIRGECMSGTAMYMTEFLGAEGTGIYIGDSPSGKDLKWINLVRCAVDTCPDLVVVKRGSSAVAEQIAIDLNWMGYAYEPLPGAGVGVEFVGLKDSSFSSDILTATQYAANIQDCDGISFDVKTISAYDRLLTGGAGIICSNTINSTFKVGTARKAFGSPSTVAFIEQGSSNYNAVYGNYGGAVQLIGANSKKFVVER